MAPEVISKTSNTADQAAGRVLAINPGTTSTKFGIFTRAGEELTQNIHHGDDEIQRFKGRPMLDRLEYRAELIEKALAEAGFTPKGKTQGAECPNDEPWVAVAGRGGLLPPMECGTYLVDDVMVAELKAARRGEHASNLGAVLALRFAQAAGVNAYIVDPVTVDEWQPCARLLGLAAGRANVYRPLCSTPRPWRRRHARQAGPAATRICV